MSIVYGLEQIRDRLVDAGADDATLALVDQILQRAGDPAMAGAPSQSQLQLVRMLMRTPVADDNIAVYNDLARLEEELDTAATARRSQQLEADSRPLPKSKKFYKEQKSKQQRG
jgi:hypothetical protein